MENKNEWRVTTIGKCSDILGDGLHGTPKYSKISEYAFINGNNLISGKIFIKPETKKVALEEYKKYKKPLNNRTILVSINGTLGNMAIYNGEKIILGKSACYFNIKENICKKFIYYVLSDYKFKKYLELNATGTTIKNISLKQMREYSFKLPPLNTQKKIAKILSDIDEKIELNNKTNDNLEKQLQFLYKSWFVDFIPFNKTIPLDWEEVLLSDTAEFINGYSYKGKELSKSDTAMATIKNFSRNGTFNSEGYKEIVVSEKVKPEHYLKDFDILVAHTDLTQNADIIGNAEMIFNKLNYQNIIFSMDLVKVIPKDKNISKFLLILLLKNSNFKNHCLGYVNGTTVLHLSKKALQEYKVFLPKNLEILNPLIILVSKIYEKFSLLNKENEKLTNLKNYLLPRLMNGEIDVENIEL